MSMMTPVVVGKDPCPAGQHFSYCGCICRPDGGVEPLCYENCETSCPPNMRWNWCIGKCINKNILIHDCPPPGTPVDMGMGVGSGMGMTGSTGPAGVVSLSPPADPENWYKVCDKCTHNPISCVWWKKGVGMADMTIMNDYTLVAGSYQQKAPCPIIPGPNGKCPSGYVSQTQCPACTMSHPACEAPCRITCVPRQHGGAGNMGGHGPRTCVENVLCIRGAHWSPTACKCVPDTMMMPPAMMPPAMMMNGGTTGGTMMMDGGGMMMPPAMMMAGGFSLTDLISQITTWAKANPLIAAGAVIIIALLIFR